MLKYLILFILLFSCINTGMAIKPNLDYTNSIASYNTSISSSDILYIEIPAGNIIDSIAYFPIIYTGIYGTYTWNNTYIANDLKYTNEYEVKTSYSLIHFYSSKYEYDIRQTVDDNLNYHKAYETYVYEKCFFPQVSKSFFGSYPNQDENIITIENEVFSYKGILRSTNHLEVFNTEAYTPRNFTIQCNNIANMNIVVTYKKYGVHTSDYFISQLSPTLKNIYNIAFNWIDEEYYILNIFIIVDKLIILIFFWLTVIATSFIPILFITLLFVIPFMAYYNSYNRKTFVYNLTMYYSRFFNLIFRFIRFIILLITKFIEIVRTLIPII